MIKIENLHKYFENKNVGILIIVAVKNKHGPPVRPPSAAANKDNSEAFTAKQNDMAK